MLHAALFNLRSRSAAIITAVGVASVTALGLAAIAPTAADADPGSGPVNTQLPSLAGSGVQGSVITLTPGTFADETTQDGTWEQCASLWRLSCTATTNRGLTYTLSTDDPVGDYIRLQETAVNDDGSTTVWSNAVGPITAGSVAPSPPSEPSPPSTPGTPDTSGYAGPCTRTISPGTDPGAVESTMSAGQTLCLKSGTYDSITESDPNYFFASGTSGNPIVVTSAPGQTATIEGSDWMEGANVTLEHLNLNVSDTLGTHRSSSSFSGCASVASDGLELDASNVVLQDNNIYESVYRDELIGVNYSDSGKPVANDVITHNNIGPAGSCKQLDHLVYDAHSTGLQITQNWFFDDPYGYGVQLYTGPSNTTITGNVFDNVLDGVMAASSGGGNTIAHNVGINLPNVGGYASGRLINCYESGGATATNNAVYNAGFGLGDACGGLNIGGTNPVLTDNPFDGGENSDEYALASNSAAAAIAGYGLWDGQGPPSPNPALSYPQDPGNPGPYGY